MMLRRSGELQASRSRSTTFNRTLAVLACGGPKKAKEKAKRVYGSPAKPVSQGLCVFGDFD